MIPPSILLIIYGLLTEQSIGRLFSAAILPGILGLALYAACIAVTVRLNPSLAGKPTAAGTTDWSAIARAWPVASIFAIVIGGIQTGLFSPTEAAAVGAFSAVVLAALRRKLDRAASAEAMRETVSLTGIIALILVGAALFNFFIETTGLPQFLIAQVEQSGMAPFVALLMILAFYLILGCFMDAMSMIMLTIPFVFPLVVSLGFDPIWFGIVVVTVAELGLITPPIGMNLFVVQGVVGNLSSATVIRGIGPFIIADVVRLGLITAVPALTLWLPGYI
jgi:tripartite ATP-independent transporter DctM subunit